MNTQNIECPKCGAGIPITEALAGPILEAERNRLELEMRQRSTALETREQELQKQRQQLATQQKEIQSKAADVEKVVDERLAVERAGITASESKRIAAEFQDQLTAARRDQQAQAARITELQQAELDFRKKSVALEEVKRQLELNVARRLDAERGQIRDQAVRDEQKRNQALLAAKDETLVELNVKLAGSQRAELKVRKQRETLEAEKKALELEVMRRLPAATNQAITAIVVDPGVLLPTFLQEWLNLQVGFWRRLAASSRKDPNITKEDVSQFPVPIPPIGEQTRMVTLATVFQQTIASVQKLKDLNRLLFMGHRQRLLQPGSDGEGWMEYRLGDLFTERSETARTDLPLLSITADRGVISREDVDRKDSSSVDKTKYKRIARGDIGYNTMRMWQGVSALSTLEGIVSPAYTICVPGPLVNVFFRNSQGLVDDTLNLKFSNFSRIRVKVPPIQTQTVIARALIALDQELALLERYQDSLRKQKNCLMTKLLTGNISYRESARA
jgi:type I restriction enzyme S subunit